MKIVEEYAQRKVEKDREQIVINMFNNGFSIEDIVRGTNFKSTFVKKVLSTNLLI